MIIIKSEILAYFAVNSEATKSNTYKQIRYNGLSTQSANSPELCEEQQGLAIVSK